MESRGRLVDKVTAFLDANYPCHCADADCPGNGPEAGLIVDMVIGDRTW